MGRRVTVPQHAHPFVRRMFEEMLVQGITLEQLADRAGLHHGTIRDWRSRGKPVLPNIEAVINALGYRLVWEPIERPGEPRSS